MLDVFFRKHGSYNDSRSLAFINQMVLTGRSLKETIVYFIAIHVARDPLAYLGGREKAPYRFINQKPSLCVKDTLAVCKTIESEIQKVSASSCCNK